MANPARYSTSEIALKDVPLLKEAAEKLKSTLLHYEADQRTYGFEVPSALASLAEIGVRGL